MWFGVAPRTEFCRLDLVYVNFSIKDTQLIGLFEYISISSKFVSHHTVWFFKIIRELITLFYLGPQTSKILSCECGECTVTLRYRAWFLSGIDYSSEEATNTIFCICVEVFLLFKRVSKSYKIV